MHWNCETEKLLAETTVINYQNMNIEKYTLLHHAVCASQMQTLVLFLFFFQRLFVSLIEQSKSSNWKSFSSENAIGYNSSYFLNKTINTSFKKSVSERTCG